MNQLYVKAWENIGCNEMVLEWIKQGVSIPFVSNPPEFQLKIINLVGYKSPL